jgi:hypothetical protein
VAPGQQLILISLASEEDQRCRVAFVGEPHFGRRMIGIQFTQSALGFWHVGTLPTAP